MLLANGAFVVYGAPNAMLWTSGPSSSNGPQALPAGGRSGLARAAQKAMAAHGAQTHSAPSMLASHKPVPARAAIRQQALQEANATGEESNATAEGGEVAAEEEEGGAKEVAFTLALNMTAEALGEAEEAIKAAIANITNTLAGLALKPKP